MSTNTQPFSSQTQNDRTSLPSTQHSQKSDPSRSPKACEACRALKIGCVLDESNSSGACRRCVKRSLECIRLPVVPRRKKRSDVRLSRLQENIANLHASKSLWNDGTISPSAGDNGSSGFRILDVVDAGVLDASTAYQLFDFWVLELSPLFPMVVLRPQTQAEVVRHSRPLLFLAILAVAARVTAPELQEYLTHEVWKLLAHFVLVTGQPELEVIQALLVTAIHYSQPEEQRRDYRNYHQLIHAAATMAMDAGMGKRSVRATSRLLDDPWERGPVRQAANSAEVRRTWLGIYYLCSTIATILRRPHLLRWSPYTQESLAILSNAEDAVPSDAWLCHMVRAEHIVEEVHFQFGFDDPVSSVSLADRNTEAFIKIFEKKMQEWRVAVTPDMPPVLVELADAHTTLCIHEVALHHEHNIDDFKPPFSMPPSNTSTNPQRSFDTNTPSSITSLTISLHSIHRICGGLLSVSATRLRLFPVVVFVRMLYAGLAFLKLNSIITANNALASVFTADDLRTESYFEKLVAMLAETSECGKYRATGEFWEQVCLMRLAWLKTRPNTQSNEIYQQASSPDAPASENPPNIALDASVAAAPKEQVSALPTQDDSMFDFDADIDIDSFDMLGQFENGMSSFWPSWNVDSIS